MIVMIGHFPFLNKSVKVCEARPRQSAKLKIRHQDRWRW